MNDNHIDIASVIDRDAEPLVARGMRGDVIHAVDESGSVVLTVSSYDGSALDPGVEPADDASYDEEPVMADAGDGADHVAFWLR